MSGRRGGNRIRGPQSALTDFLAANNISAAQIRDDYERRMRQTQQDGNAGEGPSNQSADQSAVATPASAETEAEEEKVKKRKRSQKDAIERIKKAKKSKKKGKKRDDDDSDEDDDDYDDEWEKNMYKKARPAPGQFENCEICSKRFTVTPYSKAGPDGGLLCTPCGKHLAKDLKQQEKKATKRPAGKKRRKLESDRLDGIAVGGAKSLQQICIEKVAKHHDDLEELGDMPQPVLERLSEIFSKKRVMKSRTFRLFLRPDLESVVVHDAAYLEPDDYLQMFAIVPNMRRLVLANACQMKDEAVDYMLERCHRLRHIQLYAANLISNGMWHRVFREVGHQLEVIQLKWLDASFEDPVVEDMVRCCQNLNRVKFKLCRKITEDAVAALIKLPKLQHLSLQMNHEVSNSILCSLISARGSELRTLSLEKFFGADDSVLSAVHNNCHQLTKLRFSENDTATDSGYIALFTNWKSIPLTFADFNSTRDVDNNNPDGPEDPVGMASSGFKAMMVHSGSNLRHLDIASCRHIELSAFMDVFNGELLYPALEHINLSFCNKVDNTVIAGIFKSCPALKKLVAFGCFNVRDIVVPREIALIGVPRAQDAIEQFGLGIDVEEAIERMVEVAV